MAAADIERKNTALKEIGHHEHRNLHRTSNDSPTRTVTPQRGFLREQRLNAKMNATVAKPTASNAKMAG